MTFYEGINDVQQWEIAPLLIRPVGRPPKHPVILYDDSWYRVAVDSRRCASAYMSGGRGPSSAVRKLSARCSMLAVPTIVVCMLGLEMGRMSSGVSGCLFGQSGFNPRKTKQLPDQRLSRVSKERSLGPLVRETSSSVYCPKCAGLWPLRR